MAQCRDTSLAKEAGTSPRSPGQIFLPAWSCPARIAYQPVVRAGAAESAATDGGATRNGMRRKLKRIEGSWTWCRTGLLRLLSEIVGSNPTWLNLASSSAA